MRPLWPFALFEFFRKSNAGIRKGAHSLERHHGAYFELDRPDLLLELARAVTAPIQRCRAVIRRDCTKPVGPWINLRI